MRILSEKPVLLLGILSFVFFEISANLFSQTSGANAQVIKTAGPPEISGGAAMARKRVRVPFMDVDKGPRVVTTTPLNPNAPTLFTTIEGFDFDDNITETGGSVFVPPDPIGAAGPEHVVAVVNVMIEWYKKDGTFQYRDALADFFTSLSPLTLTFDPKVIYDQYAERFVVVTLEQTDVADGDPVDSSRILVAVSDDSDPNGTWYFHAIDSKIDIGGTDHWADYPGFAVDEEVVYITNNMYTFGASSSYTTTFLWIIDKGLGSGGFYDGGTASVTLHDPYGLTAGSGSIATTTQPAHMFGAGPPGVGTFLTSYSGLTAAPLEFVQVIQVDDPLGPISFAHQFISVGDIENFSSGMPDAPQMGTGTEIETNDRRALHAVWRDDVLWMSAQIVPPSGADAGQATAHWFELNTSSLPTLTLADQGDVGGEDIAPSTHTFFPSIAVDGNGNMAIGFSASASTIYAGAYYTGRLVSDSPGTVQPTGVLRSGLDYYVRTLGGEKNRWGDYSGMSLDPADEVTFWVFNEYAITRGTPIDSEDGRWGTAFGSFSFAPAAPTLASPSDGAAGVTTSPTLSWNASSGATSYRLQVSTSPTFSTTVFDQTGITSTSQAVSGLANNTTHYWRVNATSSAGTSGWSNSRSFTTILAAPTLVSPSNGATGQPTTLTLSWNSSPGAQSYRLQVSSDSSFGTTVFDDSTLASTSQQVGPLSNNTTQYWRVNAKNAGGTSDWSMVWNFTTSAVAPAPPMLASPADGDTVQSTTILLTWNASSGADTYRLQVSTDSSFATTVFDDSTLADTSQQVGPLSNNTTHFWRVNAENTGGTSGWSSVRSLATGLQGDFSGDNQVDVSDLVLFAANFGLSSGDPGYDAIYDLSGDFTVDVSDLVIFASVFGTTGPAPPGFDFPGLKR